MILLDCDVGEIPVAIKAITQFSSIKTEMKSISKKDPIKEKAKLKTSQKLSKSHNRKAKLVQTRN